MIAVIPARSGSKGIANKNFRPLHGKSLVLRSVEAAVASEVFEDILVTVDINCPSNILQELATFGPLVKVHMRPSHLAVDTVHAVHAVLDAVDSYGVSSDCDIMMLLPTAPCRSPELMEKSKNVLVSSNAPAVIGVRKTKWVRNNVRILDQSGTLLAPFAGLDTTAQRQTEPLIFVVTGTVFAANAKVLRESRTFHVPGAVPVIVSEFESLDINDLADWELAEKRLREMEQ